MNFYSVNIKIIVPITLLTIILLSLLGSIMAVTQYDSSYSALELKSKTLGQLISHISEFHILNFDYEPLKMIAEEALEDSDVVYVAFYDENMQPISDFNTKSTKNTSDILMNKFEIRDNEKQVAAWLELGLSKKQLSDSIHRNLGIIISSVLLTSLLLIMGISRILKHIIINPIRKIVNISEEIAEKGDLTKNFEIQTSDEIGYLSKTLNKMCEKIENIIAKSSEISKGLALSSTQEASSVQTTSAALEQISSMSKKTSDIVVQMKNYMKNAGKICNHSDKDIKKLSVAMNEVSEKSNSIFDIINVIDNIAFQTDLLALNAAVEAARVGEIGAGFGVVANEVRNLAIRSTKAAKESSELIGSTLNKIDEVGTLVKKAEDAFLQLSEVTIQVSNLTENTNIAFNEQLLGIDQINNSVIEINNISQKNASLSDSLWNEIKWFQTVCRE